MNQCILHMFKGTFLLDGTDIINSKVYFIICNLLVPESVTG